MPTGSPHNETEGSPVNEPEPTARRGPTKVDLAAALATFDEAWSPRIVGRYNGNKIFLAKAKGEFVWHSHPDTDDLFLVLEGRLTIQLRDGDVELERGELFVVPRGIEHCPRSEEGASILLIEPEGTPNTGDAATAAPELEL
jgi:mannose-6-phosphate isomerase-like protein (cupin superfamily)